MAKGAMALIAIAVVCSWLIAFQYGRHYESSARAKERATLYTVYQLAKCLRGVNMDNQDYDCEPLDTATMMYVIIGNAMPEGSTWGDYRNALKKCCVNITKKPNSQNKDQDQ